MKELDYESNLVVRDLADKFIDLGLDDGGASVVT